VKDRASAPAPNGHPDASGDLDIEESILIEVSKALRQIEFGSIVIKIHQGRVVGLETSTKLRLDQ
jgi:hypothetical protein